MKRRKIFGLIVAVILFTAAAFLYKIYVDTKNLTLDSNERKKAITDLLGHAQTVPQTVVSGEQSYVGKYFSLQYPKSATIYHRDPTYSPSPDELESLLFQESQPRLFFSILVLNRPEMQKIEDFPSVSVRLKQTDAYTSSQITTGGVSGIEFIRKTPSSDTESFEKSAFFYLNGKIYSFALTGGNMDDINSLFDPVINSVKFY